MAILETSHEEVDVAAVQHWLAQPTRLAKTTTISLPCKELGDDAAALLAALTLRCQLQTLRLPGNCIGDDGAGCLAESLRLLPPLRSLDLSSNRLTALGATHVARVFFEGAGGSSEAPQAARTLDLSENHLLDHGVAGVARLLPRGHGHVNGIVKLRGVSCGSPALPEVYPARLLGLDLSFNGLGSAAAASLATAAKRRRWRSLHISRISEPGGASLAALARPLAECLATLTDLECGYNNLGDQLCCQIIEGLQNCAPKLRKLAMPHTGFGLRACGVLGQAFGRGAQALQTLDLSENQLVDVSLELLTTGLCRGAWLQELRLARNAITCRGTMLLAGALHAQRHLAATEPTALGVLRLELQGNPVGNAGAKALAEAANASAQEVQSLHFQVPWGLERLDLRSCKVTLEGLTALGAAVASRTALLDAASRHLDDQALDHLRERWRDACPAGLQVLGLDLSTPNARLEQVARSRLSIQDSSLESSEDLLCWIMEELDDTPHTVAQGMKDLLHCEGYFGGPSSSKIPACEKEIEEPMVPEKEVRLEEKPPEAVACAGGKGKGPGKGPQAPPKGKGGKGQGKGLGKGKAEAKGLEAKAKAAPAPFGRRMHWVHPRYKDLGHATVFGDQVDIDASTLASLLSAQGPKRPVARKTEGIKVLDACRAQNMAIVLSKLPVSSQQLCHAMIHLDFEAVAMSEDLIELLTAVLPTPEECEKLLMHQDHPEELRDVEQKVLPFASVPRSAARLRLLRLAAFTAAPLLDRCAVLGGAAEEARTSQPLRQLFAVILRIGNYINHGNPDGPGAAMGFSIETLPAITSFKLGAMSALHFLCTTFRRSQPDFLHELLLSLPSLAAAGRESSAALKAGIQHFHQELEFARRELKQVEEHAAESMTALVAKLEAEVLALDQAWDQCYERCVALQRYFCEEPSSGAPAFESFFQCLHDFLETLRKAWKETEPRVQPLKATPSKAKASQRRPRKAQVTACPPASSKELLKASTVQVEANVWDVDVESFLDEIFGGQEKMDLEVPKASTDVDELIDSIFD